jgi:hypothetical protein
LDEDADPIEILAFERAYHALAGRRIAMRWPADALAPTDFVRRRLSELPPLREAQAATSLRARIKVRLSWTRLTGAVVLCGLAGVGVYAIVEQIVH